MDGDLRIGLKAWIGSKSVEYARVMLAGLLIACPLGKSSEDCPLSDVRSLPPEERDNWPNSLADSEIQSLYSTHYECLKAREALLA